MKPDLQTVKRISGFILTMLIFILFLMALGSCTLTKNQRKANKFIKKMERFERKHPGAFDVFQTVSIDTVVVPIKTEVEVLVHDTVEIDKILEKFVTDTIEITSIRYKVLQSLSKDTLYLDSVFVHARAWNAHNGLNGFIFTDSIPIKKEVQRVEVTRTVKSGVAQWYRSAFWVLIVIVISFIFIVYFLPKILRPY